MLVKVNEIFTHDLYYHQWLIEILIHVVQENLELHIKIFRHIVNILDNVEIVFSSYFHDVTFTGLKTLL